MKLRFAITLLILSVCFRAAYPAPPALIDRNGPAEQPVTLSLRELWRAGGEDEEVLFGNLSGLARHPGGDLYVLDNQLCQVEVFGPEGDHLRTLSREGDGPGEIRQPIGLAFLPGDILGIGTGFPGKVVAMRLDGTPLESRYPIGEPAEGNIGIMISLRAAGDLLAATGGRIVFSPEGDSHTLRFLAVSEPGGAGYRRILERTTPIDPTGRSFVEKDNYYIDTSWDLGPDGRIYAPMTRDRYEVSVFDRTGEPLLTFGRDLPPRRRTAADKEQVGPLINVNGSRNREGWVIEDHDPAVSRVMVDPDHGEIWVLTPHGTNEQPDGVLETWDVFSSGGEYLRQVAVPRGEGIRDGTCNLVGGGRLVVVRGVPSPYYAGDGGDEPGDQAEAEPLEIICYEVR